MSSLQSLVGDEPSPLGRKLTLHGFFLLFTILMNVHCPSCDAAPGTRSPASRSIAVRLSLSSPLVGTVTREFPPHSGRDFPASFAYTAKHIYKHLFRVFAHLYHAHFDQILHLSIEAHFNSLFAHFLAFGKEFDLLVMKDLMTPQGMGQGVAELGEKWREMGILEV